MGWFYFEWQLEKVFFTNKWRKRPSEEKHLIIIRSQHL